MSARRPALVRLVDGLAACSRGLDRAIGVLIENAQRQDARAVRAARARRRRRV